MSTQSSGGTFPFLSLRSESRQRIYEFCSPQSIRFIINGGYCQRAPEEHADLRNYTNFKRDISIPFDHYHSPERPAVPANTDHRSSLPQLLRTCRQINSEVKALLYTNNIFQHDTGSRGSWGELRLFGPESRKEIRHMVVELWDSLHSPPSIGQAHETWINILGRLSTLQLIVGRPRVHTQRKWEKELKEHLESLKRIVPEHAKIVVDVDGEDSARQLVETIIPNRCTFEQLVAGDEIFKRGIFARRDLVERSDEYREFTNVNPLEVLEYY